MFNKIVPSLQHRVELETLSDIIKTKGGSLLIAGGAVRNVLLNKKVNDIDLVIVGLDIEEVEEILDKAKKVGNHFPVYLLSGYEVAMARTEVSTGEGHKDFEVSFGKHVTIEEDAYRRDFTINALYFDIFNKETLDPTGKGFKDIEDKNLSPVGNHFVDDPLRVFRAGRFLAEYLDLNPTNRLIKVCKEVVKSDKLKSLPAERVAEETNKAFRGNCPKNYFKFLNSVGALSLWFPEIAGLSLVKDRHNGNTYNHVMEMLNKKEIPVVGWSILAHDIGKMKTDPDDYPHHYGHENEKEFAENFLDRYKLSNKVKRTALKCQKYHMKLHSLKELRPGTVFDMMEDLNIDESIILSIVHKRDCESAGRKNNSELFLDLYSNYKDVCDLIDGHSVINKHPDIEGERVGFILREWRINEFKKYV